MGEITLLHMDCMEYMKSWQPVSDLTMKLGRRRCSNDYRRTSNGR